MLQVCIIMKFSTIFLEKYSQRIEVNSSPLGKRLLEKFALKKMRQKVLRRRGGGVGATPMGRPSTSVEVYHKFASSEG